MDDVKAILFARWLATCYADTHLDSEKRCEHDKGFDSSDAISCLNRENSYWYKEQFVHFTKTVWSNYVKNGTIELHKKLFENLEN